MAGVQEWQANAGKAQHKQKFWHDKVLKIESLRLEIYSVSPATRFKAEAFCKLAIKVLPCTKAFGNSELPDGHTQIKEMAGNTTCQYVKWHTPSTA